MSLNRGHLRSEIGRQGSGREDLYPQMLLTQGTGILWSPERSQDFLPKVRLENEDDTSSLFRDPKPQGLSTLV